MGEKKGSKVISTVCYVIGSIAALAAACVVISELMPHISGTINKAAARKANAKRDDDDWGPVIEKKVVETEEEI